MIQQNDRTTTTSSAKSATTTMNNNNNSKARRISDQHHQNHHQHAHHHFPQQQQHHKTTPATQSNVSSTSSTQPGHQAEEEMRIDLISRVLTSGDITREHLHKDDLALNSIQLINFMHFYYDEGQSTSVWALNENGSVHEKQPISVCFPCIACSYKFSFEHTFHQHLDRRSFVIRLNCLKCGMFKTFFNKCKLFYHIYSHKVHLLEPIFKSVQIEPMPIDKMNQFMFGTGTAAADSNKSAFQHQYLDLDMLFNNFEGLCDEWEVNANSHSHTLASFSLSNRILNNRFKIHEIDIHELKLFIKKLMINRYLIFKCGVCDALFFDARELRTHFAKSQAAEFSNTGSSSLLPADVANTLVKSPEALSLEEEQILSQHKKLHLKSLMTKHVAFEASSFVRNNMMMNTVSFKKLQYTTRCYTLALLNTFTSNFKLYKNSNPQQADVVEVEPSPTSPPTSNHHQQQQPQQQPLICPECGLSFDAKSKEGHARFRHHLLYECLFTLKHQVAELKCAIRGCSFSTESEQQMVAHWSQAHLVKRFECNLCAVQCGLRYAFDDVKNHLVYANKNGHSTNGPVTYGNLLKYVVNGREHQSNRATCNESRLLNEALVTHINEHQAESHRGEQVELKLVYKCLCKRVQHQQKYMQMGGAVQLSAADDCNEDELELDECAHDDWKSCRLHILAAASQPVYSLKCAKCQGLIVHKDFKSVMSDYAEHMRIHRDTDNESFFLCPICGIVKKERTLNEHVVKNHNQLNLNRHPTSCFYNMVTSLLDLSPDRVQDKSHLNPNNPNLFSFKFLAENFPKDYYIYFCLNCRLFYSSNSTFSHNCWTVSMSSGAEKSDSANSASNSNSNSKPLTNGSGKPQSSAANNYFSPIYLKFNVRQLFDKSSAGNATTPIASKQTPTQEAETSGVETATSSSNGPVKPSTSSSSSSSSLSSSKQQNNDSTAFSNKRMRVDSIIEKLKP